MDELEKQIGSVDDVLGPIPRQEELMTEIKSIEDEIKAETEESASMASGGAKSAPQFGEPDLADDESPAAPGGTRSPARATPPGSPPDVGTSPPPPPTRKPPPPTSA